MQYASRILEAYEDEVAGLYARYVTECKALELVGPPEDQPILTALTAHEVQLIEWMQAETELTRKY